MAADLEFRIGAELTEIKGALASLRKDFAAVGQAAQQAGSRNAFAGLEGKVGAAVGAVGRLAAAFFTLQAAIRLVGQADELNTLNARLRLATSSTEEFERAQAALFAMAQRTRTGLGETIALYSRIAQATKDAGVGQGVLLEVVETINQAVQLSGASTQAAEQALVQLGQGLASGTLRGEELNSVLEQTPALADAIAKGLGKTRGELRQLGQDGKLTAEQVITALQKQRDVVASQFAQLPLTVGQAVTQLKNAGLQLLGAFDTAAQATGGLAKEIAALAAFLSSDEAIGAVIEFAAAWSNAFALIVGDVREAVQVISDATRGITGEGETIFTFIGRAFRELPINVRTAVKIAAVEIAAFVDSTLTAMKGVADYIKAVFDPDVTIEQVRTRLLRAQAAIEDARRSSIDAALSERQKAIDEAGQARAAAEAARKRAAGSSGSRAKGNFRTALTDAQKREAEQIRKAELDAEEKLLKDSADRQKSILQQLYEDGIIAARQYYAAREALELQAIDRAIEIERRRAAAGGADAVKAKAEIELLERQKADVQRSAQRELAKDQRERDREVAELRAQDLENQGQLAAAARIRLEQQYSELLRKLGKDSEEARLVQKLIDTGVAKAQFDDLQAQFERVQKNLQARLQAITNQRDAGSLDPETAKQQQVQAREQALADLRALNAEIQRLAADPNALPAVRQAALEAAQAIDQLAVDSLTGLDAAIVSLRSSLANLREGLAQELTGAGVDALSRFFESIATGSKSAGEALRDFVRSFAASMAQIASRALATYAVLQILDFFFPGAGKLVAASGNFAGIGAQPYHSGGMVSRGRPTRNVNPLLFLGAPRMHGGGMVGLRPGEVPAILQEGERVQSRAEVAAGGGGGGTRIINALDPSLLDEWADTPGGEKVIMNVIGRNAATLRNIL